MEKDEERRRRVPARKERQYMPRQWKLRDWGTRVGLAWDGPQIASPSHRRPRSQHHSGGIQGWAYLGQQ
jgi:hypothetical protein